MHDERFIRRTVVLQHVGVVRVPGEPDIVPVADLALQRERRMLLHDRDEALSDPDLEPCLSTEINHVLDPSLKEIGPRRKILRLLQRNRKLFRTDAQMCALSFRHLFVIEHFQRGKSVNFQYAVIPVDIADRAFKKVGISDEGRHETVFRGLVNLGRRALLFNDSLMQNGNMTAVRTVATAAATDGCQYP